MQLHAVSKMVQQLYLIETYLRLYWTEDRKTNKKH